MAAEAVDGLRLITYGLPYDGGPFMRDWVPAGEGRDFRVVALAEDLFATAHVADDDTLIMRSWSIDPVTGSLSGPLGQATAPKVSDVEIAGREQRFLATQVVAALRRTNGNLEVRSWDVWAATGGFVPTGSDVGGAIGALDINHVDGFGLSDDVYAVAVRGGAGLNVITYDIPFGETLERRDSSGGTFPMENGGAVEIASLADRGVLVAFKESQAGHTSAVVPWSIDGGPDVAQPNLLADAVVSDANGKLLGLCRLPDDQAEGDFLVAEKGFFDQALQLGARRSGERA
ncbi:MAG: hypothetical protein QNK04_05340 [Myxococcota bacterium]|nr:hypothetical protein [Myxococcota bacterium]